MSRKWLVQQGKEKGSRTKDKGERLKTETRGQRPEIRKDFMTQRRYDAMTLRRNDRIRIRTDVSRKERRERRENRGEEKKAV